MSIEYTIGFVDEDRNEVRRYRSRLTETKSDVIYKVIGYDLSPGREVTDLIDEIYNSEIDLLMVDFLLNEKGKLGFNGDRIIRDYSVIKPQFPMIIFTSKETQAIPKVDDVNIIYDKANILESEPALERFVTILNKNIVKYKKDIKTREDRIQELIRIREGGSKLSDSEKAELYRLQFELTNLDQRTKESPDQLLVDLKLDQLSTTVDEAEELLKKLTDGDDSTQE